MGIYKLVKADQVKKGDLIFFELGDMYSTFQDLGGENYSQSINKAKHTFLEVVANVKKVKDRIFIEAKSGEIFDYSSKSKLKDVKILTPKTINGWDVKKGDFVFVDRKFNVVELPVNGTPIINFNYYDMWVRVLGTDVQELSGGQTLLAAIGLDTDAQSTILILFEKNSKEKAQIVRGVAPASGRTERADSAPKTQEPQVEHGAYQKHNVNLGDAIDIAFNQIILETKPIGLLGETYLADFDVDGMEDSFLYFRKEGKLQNGDDIILNVNALDIHNSSITIFRNGKNIQLIPTEEILKFDQNEYEPMYQYYLKLLSDFVQGTVSDEPIKYLWPDGRLVSLYRSICASGDGTAKYMVTVADTVLDDKVCSKVFRVDISKDENGNLHDAMYIENNKQIQSSLFKTFNKILAKEEGYADMDLPVYRRLRKSFEDRKKASENKTNYEKYKKVPVTEIKAGDKILIEPGMYLSCIDTSFELQQIKAKNHIECLVTEVENTSQFITLVTDAELDGYLSVTLDCAPTMQITRLDIYSDSDW